MPSLEVGQIYYGHLQGEYVVYKGLQISDWYPYHAYHQFEYLIPKKVLAGYGQSDDQVIAENYKHCATATVLYGEQN